MIRYQVSHNRRYFQRLIAIALVIAVALTIASIAFFNTNFRHAIFVFLPQVFAGVSAFIIAVSGVINLIEWLERFRSYREWLDALRGYDIDMIREGKHEIPQLPRGYIHRHTLENELEKAFLPSQKQPKIVVMWGEEKMGKTVLLSSVLSDVLNDRFRGQIIYTLGALTRIEGQPGDTTQQMQQRLLKRIIDHTAERVHLHDEGDVFEAKREALTQYFKGAKFPWLIVLNRIEANFPFDEILPYVLGKNNTVVLLLKNQADIPLIRGLLGNTISINTVSVTSLTQKEALSMLTQKLEALGKSISSTDLQSLMPYLKSATPGVIQLLSDAYSSGGALTMIEEAFDNSANTDVRQSIARLVIDQLPEDYHRFIAIFTLLKAKTTSQNTLVAAATIISKNTRPEELIDQCVTRGYLERMKGHDGTPQLRVTSAGRSIANDIIVIKGATLESIVGQTLLDVYRTFISDTVSLIRSEERMTILGIMSWTTQLPRRMSFEDRILFPYILKNAFYHSISWSESRAWINFALIAPQINGEKELFQQAELAMIDAKILSALGDFDAAFQRIDFSEHVVSQLIQQKDLELWQGAGLIDELQSRKQLYTLQKYRVAHLSSATLIQKYSQLGTENNLDQLVVRIRDAQNTVASLSAHLPKEHLHVAQKLRALMQVDQAELLITIGDDLYAHKNHKAAKEHWREAIALLDSVDEQLGLSPTPDDDTFTEFLGLKGSAYFRVALISRNLERNHWKRVGLQSLKNDLQRCKDLGSLIGEATIIYQITRLSLLAVPFLDLKTMQTSKIKNWFNETSYLFFYRANLRRAKSDLLIASDLVSKLGNATLLKDMLVLDSYLSAVTDGLEGRDQQK